MQRAKNVPDAFFRFTLGKTSLFAVFAAESRSARFSGARNKSLHHAPHPAVVPVPYSHRHRRAKFWRPDSKSFCRFCAAAVPRDRQTGSRGIHEVRTYTNFTSFRLSRSATLKTEKRREFSGQDVQLYNRARTAIRLPPGQGCAPTPRQRLTAREKIPRTAHRSRTRQTENRGAPRLWRGFRFCD